MKSSNYPHSGMASFSSRIAAVTLAPPVLVWILWLSGLGGGMAAPFPTPPEPSALVARTRPALVILQSVDRRGKPKSYGTGFFISSNGVLVTARHVAQAQAGLVALTPDGKRYPVTGFLGDDSDYDLAVVKIDGDGFAPLALAGHSLPETNQWAALVSARDTVAPACSTGVIASVMSFPGLLATITTTVPVRPGQSGSPLLNSAGEVIGMVPYINTNESATASPIAPIRQLIAKASSGRPRPFATRPRNGSNRPLVFDADFKAGIEALNRQDWNQAELRIKRAAKRFRDSPFTSTTLGMIQARRGEFRSWQLPMSWGNHRGWSSNELTWAKIYHWADLLKLGQLSATQRRGLPQSPEVVYQARTAR